MHVFTGRGHHRLIAVCLFVAVGSLAQADDAGGLGGIPYPGEWVWDVTGCQTMERIVSGTHLGLTIGPKEGNDLLAFSLEADADAAYVLYSPDFFGLWIGGHLLPAVAVEASGLWITRKGDEVPLFLVRHEGKPIAIRVAFTVPSGFTPDKCLLAVVRLLKLPEGLAVSTAQD